MSGPATIDVMTAVQAQIVAQCAGIGAGLAVGLTPPIRVDAKSDVFCYLVHMMPPEDKPIAAGTVIQRTHHIHVRLWMRTPDDASETLFLAFSDAISYAFFQDQKLGGLANSTTFTPVNLPPYYDLSGTILRQRVWEMAVVTRFTVSMQ
jgi:hypothetical protein